MITIGSFPHLKSLFFENDQDMIASDISILKRLAAITSNSEVELSFEAIEGPEIWRHWNSYRERFFVNTDVVRTLKQLNWSLKGFSEEVDDYHQYGNMKSYIAKV